MWYNNPKLMSDSETSLALKKALEGAAISYFSQRLDTVFREALTSAAPDQTAREIMISAVDRTLKDPLYQHTDLVALYQGGHPQTRDYSEMAKKALDFYIEDQAQKEKGEKVGTYKYSVVQLAKMRLVAGTPPEKEIASDYFHIWSGVYTATDLEERVNDWLAEGTSVSNARDEVIKRATDLYILAAAESPILKTLEIEEDVIRFRFAQDAATWIQLLSGNSIRDTEKDREAAKENLLKLIDYSDKIFEK